MAKKRNYIRLTEEELKTSVHESVLRILLEKSGISDEVVEATNQVVDELFKIDFKGLNWQLFVINDDSLIWPYKSIKTNVNLPNTISLPMFKDIRGFNITLINFISFDDINEYGNASGIGGGFSIDQKDIVLTIPCINQIPLRGNVYNFVAHELNHFYQDKLKGGERMTGAYKMAQLILNKQIEFTQEDYVIANLVYRLDRREIDANAHELFFQLLGRSDKINRMKNISELDNYPFINEAKVLRNNFAKPYFNNAEQYANSLKKFGLNEKGFKTFLRGGLAYIDSKIRHVVSRFFTISNKGTITTEETKKLDSWQSLVR